MRSDTRPPFLAVELAGTRVGTLVRDRSGLVSFTPDVDWLALGQVPRLGFSFLRDPRPRRQGTGLPAWFENLLPERGTELRTRICRQFTVDEADSWSLIQALGHDLPGAVVVHSPQHEVGGSELDEGEEGVARREARDEGADSDALRFSLAGVQLKFSMILRDRRLTLPAHGDSGHWIVKIPSRGFLELPAVEDATMRWAGRCGIQVAETLIMPASAVESVGPLDLPNGADVLAVRRFDRLEDGRRVHQEDLLQALEWEPSSSSKYALQPNHRIGYDGMGVLIRDVAGDEQAWEYVRRLAFVVASANDDAHLKNWSLLWPGVEPRATLTPAYDLVATLALPEYLRRQALPGSSPPTLALPLGGTRSWAEISSDKVRRFAERSGIPRAEAIFLETLGRARDEFLNVESLLPECMQHGIRQHWSRVPVLRKFLE